MSEERQDPATEPLPESRKRGTITGPPPSRGGRPGRATRPMDPTRPCMNCGDPTPGEYCPTCGQRKVDVQVSVRVLMLDVLEDQFILDRRLPRTLGALLLRPGRLTVEYVNGRIASYIHPFRLYLVSSLIFFLLLSFLSLQLVRRATLDADEPTAAAESAAADSARLAQLDAELARIDVVLSDSSLPSPAAAAVRAGRASVVQERARVQARVDSTARAPTAPTPAAAPPGPGQDAGDPAQGGTAGPGGAEAGAEGEAAEGEAAEGEAGEDAGRGGGEARTVNELFGWDDDGSSVSVDFPIPAVETALRARIQRIGAMQPRQALEELVGTFVNYVPTLMFLLLPIFALVLKLLYIRRRRFYAEHFVFLLHVHSFVFLLATVMLLLREYVAAWLELVAFGWILVYIYIALKRVYGQGWLKTFVKYWILGWMYFWILTFSLPLALVATILLF